MTRREYKYHRRKVRIKYFRNIIWSKEFYYSEDGIIKSSSLSRVEFLKTVNKNKHLVASTHSL